MMATVRQLAVGFIASFLIANCHAWTRAGNDFDQGLVVQTGCLAPADVRPLHLYGLWRAEFEGVSQGATLLLERHPEWREGLSGGINRNGVQGRISAEIENGEFSLEESLDGARIQATWEGLVVNGSCGKEIRGVWRDFSRAQAYPFTLRKLPGWN